MKLLPGCCWDLRTVGEKQLFQQRWLAQRLKQTCGSICSVSSSGETPAVFCQNQSVESTLGLRQVQVYNPSKNQSGSTPTSKIWQCSYDNFTNLTTPELEQFPNTHRKKQENPQAFLSARHPVKSAFFKFSHLAPCSFCHAPARMPEQSWRSKETKLQHGKVVKKSKAPCSSPCSSEKMWIKCLQAATGRCRGHLKPTRYRRVAGVRLPVSTLMECLPNAATTALGTWQQGLSRKRHRKCDACTPDCPASESFVLKAATKEEK